MYRPRITSIRVNGGKRSFSKVYDGRNKNLNDTYQSIAEDLFEVEQLEDFAFVIAHLLIFDEERRTLAWDTEVQNRMIRLLFLPKEFDKKFSRQNQLATDFDTKARHKSETRKDIKRAVERWLKDKQQTDIEPEDERSNQKLDLEIRLAQLQVAIETLQEEYNSIEKNFNAEIERTKDLASEINNSEIAKISVSNQLNELEKEFYSEIYQSIPPQYVLLLETLIKDGKCQVCGTSHTQLKKMGKNIKQNGECIVCRNPLQYEPNKSAQLNRDELIEKINDLRSQLETIETKQRDCLSAGNPPVKSYQR